MKRAAKALKKYFVPHEENDHKPHLLRAKSVVFVLIVALVIESTFLYGAAALAPRSKLFGIIMTNALIDETNQSRTGNAAAPVPALAVSPLLTAAAQDKANDMVANDYFAHTSPSGLTPWYWFGQVGYNFIYAGENLAVNFSDSQDVTAAWMNSPEHRANILNADFTQIGIATATGTYEGHAAVYVVELFGTPTPPPPPAEPIAFVNSAAAETVSGTVSVPLAPATTKPKSEPASMPTVVATSETFIAVSAPAQAQVGTGTVTGVTTTTAASATASSAAVLSTGALINISPQSNPIQQAASDPRQIVNDIYLAIIALFALALGINVFVKVRIQHPQLILGGMLVILVAGLLIILNQHGLAGAAIL